MYARIYFTDFVFIFIVRKKKHWERQSHGELWARALNGNSLRMAGLGAGGGVLPNGMESHMKPGIYCRFRIHERVRIQ